MPPLRILAVVLAGGRGARMGGPKALLRLGARSFLAHGAELLRRPGVSGVVAVVGHEGERVAQEAGLPAGVHIAHNARYSEGMLTSVWCGLDAAEALGAEAVLLHPVDHPLVAVETIDRVVRALQDGATIALPSHEGRRGHPGGFSRDAWPALRAAALTAGARVVLQQHPDWIVHVPGDPGCLAGIDTPDDYRRLLSTDPR
jgi:CTP:molybdopterin cytidylyltransferase MocA